MRCPLCDRPLSRETNFVESITLWHCRPCRYSWTIEELIAERERVL